MRFELPCIGALTAHHLPDDLAWAFDTAAAACDRLESEGHHVHFRFGTAGKRLVVELQDEAGEVVSRLSPAEALELACAD